MSDDWRERVRWAAGVAVALVLLALLLGDVDPTTSGSGAGRSSWAPGTRVTKRVELVQSPSEAAVVELPAADTPTVRAAAATSGVQLSPLPIGPINLSPLPIGPINLSPLGLGDVNLSPLGLGDVNLSPLGLGDVNLSPLGLGDVNLSPLGLGDVNLSALAIGPINLSPLGLGDVNLSPLPIGDINLSPLDRIPLSSIDPAPDVWKGGCPPNSSCKVLVDSLPEELQPKPLQQLTLGDVRDVPGGDAVLASLTLRQIAGDGSLLDVVTPWAALTPHVTVADFAAPGELGTNFPGWAEPTWEKRIANAIGQADATGLPTLDGGEKPFGELSLLELELVGVPRDGKANAALPFQIVPLGQIAFDPAVSQPLLDDLRLTDVDLDRSPLGVIGVASVPANTRDQVIDCAAFACSDGFDARSLADLQEAGALLDSARLGHLLDGVDSTDRLDPQALRDADALTLAEAALGFVALPTSPYTNVAPGQLTHLGDESDDLSIEYVGPAADDLVIRITLPDGVLAGHPQDPTSTSVSMRVEKSRFGGGKTIDVPFQGPDANGIIEIEPSLEPAWLNLERSRITVTMALRGLPPVGALELPAVEVDRTGDGLRRAEDLDAGIVRPAIAGNTSPADAYPMRVGSLYLPTLEAGERSFFRLTDVDGSDFTAGQIVEVHVAGLAVDADAVVYQLFGTGDREAPLRPAADTDLVVPVPAGQRAGDAGSPLVGSVRDDIVFEDLPVLEVGNERGTEDEVITVRTTADGPLLVQVGGYVGAHADGPYLLTAVVRDDPNTAPVACPSRQESLLRNAAPAASGPGLPATLAPSSADVLLYPRTRAHQIFGQEALAGVDSALAAFVEAAPGSLVVEPDLDPEVADAYARWDREPCSVERANDVVRAINVVIDRLRGTLPDGDELRSVTLVGGHDLVPFSWHRDAVQHGNEAYYGASLGALPRTDPYRAAIIAGFVPSHVGYADLEPEPYLDRYLYRPDLAVGRLLETPRDWVAALDGYRAAGGVIDVDTALVTGMDFLADAGEVIANTTDGQFGIATDRLLAAWGAADLESALGPGPALASLNAHADYDQLGGAVGTDTVDAAFVEALDLSSSVLTSIGCHTLVSIAGVSIAGPALDFAEVTARAGAAGLVGQTAYGLGLEGQVRLSEGIVAAFHEQLTEQPTIGAAFASALAEHTGDLAEFGVFDEKAIVGANFYGLPMWTLEGVAESVADVPVATPDEAGVTTVAVLPEFTRHETADGVFHTAADIEDRPGASVGRGAIAVVGQPVLPAITYRVDDGDRDAIVWDYEFDEAPGFDPDFAEVVISDAAKEAVGDGRGAALFPNVPVAVRDGRLTAIVGSFESDPDSPGLGTLRRYSSMDVQVLRGDPADQRRPIVTDLTAGTDEDTVSIEVAAQDRSGIERVVVLFEDPAFPGEAQRVVVDGDEADGDVHQVRYETDSDDVRFAVQVVDRAGNVTALWNKGALFPVDPPEPEGLLPTTGPPEGDPPGGGGGVSNPGGGGSSRPGVPSDPEPVSSSVVRDTADPDSAWAQAYTVTLDVPAGQTASYEIVDAAGIVVGGGTTYDGPVEVTGPDGTLLFEWWSTTGQRGSETLLIDTTAPAVDSPHATSIYVLAEEVPVVFDCSDATSGVTDCTVAGDVAVLDTATVGTHTLQVTAVDAAGLEQVRPITYRVVYDFQGFDEPVRAAEPGEPRVMNLAVGGTTVPIRFALADALGDPVTDTAAFVEATSAEVPCDADDETGDLVAPTLESEEIDADEAAGRLEYRWQTEVAWIGTCRALELRFADGTVQTVHFRFPVP